MITSIWTGPGGDASAARELRDAVFCRELGMEAELAWDNLDPYAFHLVLLMGETPVAAGRLSYGGTGTAKLGRICVAEKYRRQGIGDGLVKIMDFKAAMMGMGRSQVEAPEELVRFYGRIGYQAVGEPYEKWGRRMVKMEKETNDGTGENCAHQCAGA